MIPLRGVSPSCYNFRNHGLLLVRQQQQQRTLIFTRNVITTTTTSKFEPRYSSLQYVTTLLNKRRRSCCLLTTQQTTSPIVFYQSDFQKQIELYMSTTTTTEKSFDSNSNSPVSNTKIIDNFTEDDIVIENRNRIDVAIVGLPNAGKSQLLNVMTGSKIAAVSRKRHTTRESGILGARTIHPTTKISDDDDENNSNNNTSSIRCTIPTQIVFVDTPGFLKIDQAKREGLDRDLVISAKASMEYVDYTLLVVDAAKQLSDPVKETLIELIFQALASRGRLEFSDDDEDDDEEEEEIDTDSDSGIDTDDSEADEEEDGNDVTSSESESDNDEKDDDMEQIITKQDTREKFGVVLNKVDLIYPKSDLIDVAMEIGELAEHCIRYNYRQRSNRMNRTKVGISSDNVDETIPLTAEESAIVQQYVESNMPMFFYVSAKKNDGVDDVLQYLTDMATPCHSWDVEPGQVSTLTPLEQIEEVIREKIYRCLHKEVPYQIEQENRLLSVIPTKISSQGTSSNGTDLRSKERNAATTPRPTIVIHQDLIVRTKSHQSLVNGTSKQTLERIRSTAERDLSQTVFKCPVQLSLHVKLSKRSTNEKRLPSNQQNQQASKPQQQPRGKW